MPRSRHLLGPLIVALVLTGGGAAALLLPEEPGAFPSDEEIARSGFAAWPVDTPEEARAECANAEEWRKDPVQVALTFASDVLGYPDPTVDDDFADDNDLYRTLINDRQAKGIFLGSVLALERFGECWYLTEGQPREGDMGIDIATFDSASRLLLPSGCCGTVGWGDWTHTLDSSDPTTGAGEVVLDVPPEAKGRPGHFLMTSFDKHGVSESVGARSLPPLPSDEGTQRLARVDIGRRPENPKLCRMPWSKTDQPERIIRYLQKWSFAGGLAMGDDGYQRFDVVSRRRMGSNFEWRVRLDEAVLRFNFSRVADRCWVIRSIVPERAPLIEDVSAAGDRSFTFDLAPGQAGKVVVYYGVGREVQPISIRTKRLLGEPFSVSRSYLPVTGNEGLPASALVITYRKGNMHSAEYKLFEMPEGQP